MPPQRSVEVREGLQPFPRRLATAIEGLAHALPVKREIEGIAYDGDRPAHECRRRGVGIIRIRTRPRLAEQDPLVRGQRQHRLQGVDDEGLASWTLRLMDAAEAEDVDDDADAATV